jgi:hypothetical protein
MPRILDEQSSFDPSISTPVDGDRNYSATIDSSLQKLANRTNWLKDNQLVGPQGPVGDTGPQGPQGETGEAGFASLNGLTNPDGSITIIGGSNISITDNGIDTITISSTVSITGDFGDYVQKSGDMMTGDLNFNKSGSGFISSTFKNDNVDSGYIYGGDGYIGIFDDTSEVGVDIDGNILKGTLYGNWEIDGSPIVTQATSGSVYVDSILDATLTGKGILKGSLVTGSYNGKLAQWFADLDGNTTLTDSAFSAGDFTLISTTASISGGLQSQIDALSSSGVTSIEGLTGIVDISGGSGINISTAGNSIVIKNTIEYVSAPVAPSSPGEKGQRAYSSNYVYECIATNTWVRYAAASTW